MNKKPQPILEKHHLTFAGQISYNAWLCTNTKQKVVVKVGDNVTYKRSMRTKRILEFLESQNFQHIIVPSFIACSEQDEQD